MFDWREYMKLAEALASGPDEASYRSAVSRAYYAVYHVACGYRINPHSRNAVASHQSYWENEWNASSREVKSIQVRALRLLRERHNADYRSNAYQSSICKSEVSDARRLLDSIEAVCKAEIARQEAIKAARQI